MEGYENMGFETSLTKPFLRKEVSLEGLLSRKCHANFSQMELKMKAICEGRKNKLEVVQESLDQYRDVYLRVQQKLPVLHAVSIDEGEMMIQ